MIYWMSDKINEIWDEKCPWLKCIVCEIHDDELKGHIVLELEIDDENYYQLDLGVCDGLSDEEINARFVGKFGEFVKEYESWDDCCGPVLEDLEEMMEEFAESIKKVEDSH